MPEMAAIYLIGALLALGAAIALQYWQASERNSPLIQRLDERLKPHGLCWSPSQGRIVTASAEQLREERQHSERAALVLGFFAFLLSWLGLVLLAVLALSLRFAGKSREERQIFASDLVQAEHLDQDRVRELVQDFVEKKHGA